MTTETLAKTLLNLDQVSEILQKIIVTDPQQLIADADIEQLRKDISEAVELMQQNEVHDDLDFAFYIGQIVELMIEIRKDAKRDHELQQSSLDIAFTTFCQEARRIIYNYSLINELIDYNKNIDYRQYLQQIKNIESSDMQRTIEVVDQMENLRKAVKQRQKVFNDKLLKIVQEVTDITQSALATLSKNKIPDTEKQNKAMLMNSDMLILNAAVSVMCEEIDQLDRNFKAIERHLDKLLI